MFILRQKVMGTAARGIRFQSTSASSYVNKASSVASSITSKISGATKCTIYWSKVVAELSKQIYVKEGFAPPSGAEVQNVYRSLLQLTQTSFKRFSDNPQVLLDRAKNFGKQDAYKYGAITVQLFGMFALGEMIGRRHVVEYPHH